MSDRAAAGKSISATPEETAVARRVAPLLRWNGVVEIASHLYAIGDPANPRRVQLEKLCEFAPLGFIAHTGDETLDLRFLAFVQNAQSVALHFGATTIEKLKQNGKFFVHIYWLGCGKRALLQKKCGFFL